MNDLAKQLLTWAIIAIVLVSIFNHYANVGTVTDSLTYSEFLSDVRGGEIAEVHIQSDNSGNSISGRTVFGELSCSIPSRDENNGSTTLIPPTLQQTG